MVFAEIFLLKFTIESKLNSIDLIKPFILFASEGLILYNKIIRRMKMFNNPIYPNTSLMMNPQQRIEQLVNQHPQYFNQNVQQAVGSQNGWRILPVSNIEEANATPVDLSGNPLFFFNRATKEIYMKQLDQTGAAPLISFALKPQESQIKLSQEQTKPTYDFQNDLRKLNSKVDDIYRVLVPNTAPQNKPKKEQNV